MEDRVAERASNGAAEHPSGDERFGVLEKALKRTRYSQDQLIEILHVAQGVFGYLSEDVLIFVGRELRLPLSRVFGVATFYHLFTFEEPGEHGATVCTGTACFVKGADRIVDALATEFQISSGQTTEDGRFTLKTARCLGSCGLAPVVVIDGAVRGHLDAEGVLEVVAEQMAADADDDAEDPTPDEADAVAAGAASEARL
ncbi:MAG: bidirectional hydrogenase complex protein HoxE [Nitriliruptor sp.]|nr:MAG: bidirectional hydrogenase complex protein HoxE [Nitriliruptor sp.]